MPDPTQCGGNPKPTGSGTTPYGHWKCSGNEWVWIPELGRMAKMWNNFVSFFLIKK